MVNVAIKMGRHRRAVLGEPARYVKNGFRKYSVPIRQIFCHFDPYPYIAVRGERVEIVDAATACWRLCHAGENLGGYLCFDKSSVIR